MDKFYRCLSNLGAAVIEANGEESVPDALEPAIDHIEVDDDEAEDLEDFIQRGMLDEVCLLIAALTFICCNNFAFLLNRLTLKSSLRESSIPQNLLVSTVRSPQVMGYFKRELTTST